MFERIIAPGLHGLSEQVFHVAAALKLLILFAVVGTTVLTKVIVCNPDEYIS